MEKKLNMAETIREALDEEMARDDSVFVLGEDLGKYGGVFACTKGLWKKYGEKRVKDTPVSEIAIVGSALGAAMTGLRPVAEIQYLDFVTVGMDQVINQISKIRYMSGGQVKVPLVIRAPVGGYLGEAAQHSQSLECLFLNIPGLKVVFPSTPYDAKGLLKTAIRDDNPVIFLEPKILYFKKGLLPKEEYLIPLGEADIKKEGSDVSLIAYGYMVEKCLQASDKLLEEGIKSEVIDLRTLKPLDKTTILESVKKTGKAVVVHQSWKYSGFGAEVSATITEEAFDYLDAPVGRVAAEDVPIPYSSAMENFVLPQVEDIIEQVHVVVNYK